MLDELLDMVGVLEDVQAADAGESELLGSHASVAHLEENKINCSEHKGQKQVNQEETHHTWRECCLVRYVGGNGRRE